MPVREYECQAKKCGEIFELFEAMNDPPLKKCKICKRGKVIRLISLTARPVVPGDFQEEMIKIKQDAKKIAQKIIKGDQNAYEDIYGDPTAPKKEVKKPKTLDQTKGVKGGIKRSK